METYRGEWSHWLTLALTPIFFLWNPILPDAILVFYALATNLPCIFVQRYNRVVLQRILS
jgi:glycosyl-4,4'-diaponeurosporenoate acyltransferase